MKEPILYKIVRPILKFGFDILYNPTYIGTEKIPKTGKIILACNHTNERDSLLLMCSTKRVIHFMGKHTLFKGIYKPIFKGMGVIPVNRTIKDHNCLISAREVLNNDLIIGIFPEGTCNKTNKIMLPLKMGVIKLASDTDTYILPLTIKGKYKKRNVVLKYGTPYKLDSKNLDKELEKLTTIFYEIMEDKNENSEKHNN